MMRLTDVHCHYEDARFDSDRDAVIASLSNKNVYVAIDAGCTLEDSIKAKEYAEKYKHIYFCAGVHPECADKFSPEILKKITELWKHEKCVASGEIGLDYHWDENPPKDVQRETFLAQVYAAKEYDMPVVIHTRDSIGDMLEIIKKEKITNGLMHCFSESRESAKICLDAGLYFSFGGTCTFKNSVRAQENLKYIPHDRVLIETDAPYLAPVPKRGERNDSSNTVYIAEHIAMLWNMSPDEVAEITTQNAGNLFKKLNFHS